MIKVTKEEKEATKPKISYPYYGEHINEHGKSIVLFVGKDKGVCLYTKHTNNKVGEFYTKWNESLFTPITYKLICENVF